MPVIHVRGVRGGAVIGQGGFGCVFRPALKCKGSTERPANTVSKLLNVKDAKVEDAAVVLVRKSLSKISPEFQDFFIVPDESCKPAFITRQDLGDDEFCSIGVGGETSRRSTSAVPQASMFEDLDLKMKYSQDTHTSGLTNLTINKHLDKLRLIQIKDGGITVTRLARRLQNMNAADVKFFLDAMHQTMRAVHALNQAGYVHRDLKDDNLVIDNDLKIRVIDYSLGTTVESVLKGRGNPLDFQMLINRPINHFVFGVPAPLLKPEKVTFNKLMSFYRDSTNSSHYFDFKDKLENTGMGWFARGLPDVQSRDSNTSVLDRLAELMVGQTVTHLTTHSRDSLVNSAFRHNTDIYGLLYTIQSFLTDYMRTRPTDELMVQYVLKLISIVQSHMFFPSYATVQYDIDSIFALFNEVPAPPSPPTQIPQLVSHLLAQASAPRPPVAPAPRVTPASRPPVQTPASTPQVRTPAPEAVAAALPSPPTLVTPAALPSPPPPPTLVTPALHSPLQTDVQVILQLATLLDEADQTATGRRRRRSKRRARRSR